MITSIGQMIASKWRCDWREERAGEAKEMGKAASNAETADDLNNH